MPPVQLKDKIFRQLSRHSDAIGVSKSTITSWALEGYLRELGPMDLRWAQERAAHRRDQSQIHALSLAGSGST
jgi:hypothetical protein